MLCLYDNSHQGNNYNRLPVDTFCFFGFSSNSIQYLTPSAAHKHGDTPPRYKQYWIDACQNLYLYIRLPHIDDFSYT